MIRLQPPAKSAFHHITLHNYRSAISSQSQDPPTPKSGGVYKGKGHWVTRLEFCLLQRPNLRARGGEPGQGQEHGGGVCRFSVRTETGPLGRGGLTFMSGVWKGCSVGSFAELCAGPRQGGRPVHPPRSRSDPVPFLWGTLASS